MEPPPENAASSDFIDVPVLAHGVVKVKWGLHWVRRVVEVRSSGFMRISASKNDPHNGTSSTETPPIDLHLNKLVVDEASEFGKSAATTEVAKSSDSAIVPSGLENFTKAVRDISFLRTMTTGVSAYFVNLADMQLSSPAAPGPPFQLTIRTMHTCDANFRITPTTATRSFCFVSQQHRMEWVAIFESAGAKLQSIRPPLKPVVTHTTSTAISLDWHDWQERSNIPTKREDEMFEVQYRIVKEEKKRGPPTSKPTATGANTNVAIARPVEQQTVDKQKSVDDDSQTETATTQPNDTTVSSDTGLKVKSQERGGLLSAVAKRAKLAKEQATFEKDTLPTPQVPYHPEDVYATPTTGISTGSYNRMNLTIVRDWGKCARQQTQDALSPVGPTGGTGVGTSTTIEGLRPATMYQFRVRQKGYDGKRKTRGWSLWSPITDVAETLSSSAQRVNDQNRRVDAYFAGKLQPYRPIYRSESTLTKTMRVVNAGVNLAYTIGVPYGTYAYWGWQALGLGKVR